MAVKSGFPSVSAPFVDSSGRITLVWQQFLNTLFQRTGSASGTVVGTGSGSDAGLQAQVTQLQQQVNALPDPYLVALAVD